MDTNILGDTANEGDELLVRGDTDSNVPCLLPTRRQKSPLQELGRVIETEHGIVILDIVQCQQLVQLFDLLVVLNIHQRPLELLGQGVRGCADLIQRDIIFNGTINLNNLVYRYKVKRACMLTKSASHFTNEAFGEAIPLEVPLKQSTTYCH